MKRRSSQRSPAASGAVRTGPAFRKSGGTPRGEREQVDSTPRAPGGSRRLQNTLLALVFAAYLALAVGNNLAMPVGGAPDEGAHAEYVRSVAEEGRLPVLDLRTASNAQDPNGYEAHQPPLYYVLAAPAWRLARALGGGPAAPARAARFVATLIGLAGIVLIWLFARLAAGPDRPWLALAAATFAAFLPMRLSLAAAVSNDTLAEATATGVLCLLLLGLRRGYSTRLALGAGAALGVAILAKASNLLLAPIVFAGIAVASQSRAEAALRRGSGQGTAARAGFDGRALARNAGAAALGMAVVSGWWFARNQLLYHDVLMESTFQKKFAGAISAGQAAQMFGCPDMGSYMTGLVVPTTFQTFWGAFGHLTPKGFMGLLPRGSFSDLPGGLGPILSVLTFGALPPREPVAYPPPSWVYPLLALWTWAVLIGLLRAYLRSRAELARGARITGLMLGTYTLLVFASFLRFNMTYFQAQGRYLFPALAPLALAFATGWLHGFPARAERLAAAALAALMLALATYALFGVILPGFG